MSPSNINSFVGDLVQMAQAMEQLPKVEQALQEAENNNRKLTDKIVYLNDDLEQSRNYAASLEQKVRSLEVERDDASFRVLEAEDLNHTILNLVRGASVDLELAILKLDPPKPEPVKEAEPQAQPVATPAQDGQSASDPTASQTGSSPDTLRGNSVPEAVHSISELPGQSESSPTRSEDGLDQSVNSQTVTATGNVSSIVDPGPALGPYFGKRYQDMPQYIPYHDWIAGGGTDEDYYFRPDYNKG